MIGDNTESINVIPDHVSMGTDIRYFDVEYAQQLMKQFNQAAEGCSLALGGNFKLVDPVFVLDIFPEFIFNSVLEISNNLNKIRTYRRTNQEYLEQLNKMGAEK